MVIDYFYLGPQCHLDLNVTWTSMSPGPQCHQDLNVWDLNVWDLNVTWTSMSGDLNVFFASMSVYTQLFLWCVKLRLIAYNKVRKNT